MPKKLPAIIVADANFLVVALSSKRRSDDEHKAWHLLERIEAAKATLVIPTPAIAEYLVRADIASLAILQLLEGKAFVRTAPFDRAAATECAQLDAAAIGRGDKKDGLEDLPWQKIKVDRQIVAIAKANGAGLIITADACILANSMRAGIPSLPISDLTFPPGVRQGNLKLVKGSTDPL